MASLNRYRRFDNSKYPKIPTFVFGSAAHTTNPAGAATAASVSTSAATHTTTAAATAGATTGGATRAQVFVFSADRAPIYSTVNQPFITFPPVVV